ncbi:hypothetical protein [Pantoea dispersa]|uniref:hypothetical protein n=1 Tax=Pantoea dispersa TaxID=59814 RepID=UPI001331315F|nr:hypothetical protein [Pantoea dispersa]
MKEILISITIFIVLFFINSLIYQNYNWLYKDVKITDYLSSVFTVLSFFVAFNAYKYAKDYLKQERHKSASAFAIDVLHKDMVLLGSLEKEDTLLYILGQRLLMYTHSSSKQHDIFCVKHMAKVYNELIPMIDVMRSNIELVNNDIFKAKIVGCNFINKDNDVLEIIEDYNLLKNHLNRLSAVLAAFLIPYYGYDYSKINPDSKILIELPFGSYERQQELKDVNENYIEADKTIKSIMLKFRGLRSGKVELNEVFTFS